MPWFKVDDNLAFHHKVMAAGNSAIGMWVRAGSACAQQLTDGFVPDHMIPSLGGAQLAKRLVSVGLWDRAEGGYQFHQWDERQPSKEQVEADRAAARERQRKAREAAKSRRDSRRDIPRSSDVSHGPPDPTRPDPTRSSSGTTELPTRKRAAQIPDGWQPNAQHKEYANENRLTLDSEAAQFRDHHVARGSTMKDWDAAFRTWLRNAVNWRKDDGPRDTSRSHLPHVDELEQPPDGLSVEEYAAWDAERRARRRA